MEHVTRIRWVRRKSENSLARRRETTGEKRGKSTEGGKKNGVEKFRRDKATPVDLKNSKEEVKSGNCLKKGVWKNSLPFSDLKDSRKSEKSLESYGRDLQNSFLR